MPVESNGEGWVCMLVGLLVVCLHICDVVLVYELLHLIVPGETGYV